MSLELTLLGTGTPTPLVSRAGSGYLVSLNEDRFLFDCGPQCVRRLLEHGLSPTCISRLFLTHLHYDHCVDYGYLALSRWDQGVGKIPELQVVGPAPVERMTEMLFGEAGVYGPDLAARTKHPGSEFIYEMRGGRLPRQRPRPAVTEVENGSTVQGPGWRVQVAEVVHCQPQLLCLAYRLETQFGTLVFGGDTGPTDALVALARGADVLVHMCHFVNGMVTDPRLTSCCSGHLDAARTAKAAGVSTLVLVHLTNQIDQPGVRERVLFEAGEVFGGVIILGEDLLTVPVGGMQTVKIQ